MVRKRRSQRIVRSSSVALYHRNEDMFAIPLQIAELNRKYKFYMRHHPYIPDWDTNLYCI